MLIFSIVGNICVRLSVPDRLGIRFIPFSCNHETGLEHTWKTPLPKQLSTVQGVLLVTSACKPPSGDCMGRGQRPGAGRAPTGFLDCLDMDA